MKKSFAKEDGLSFNSNLTARMRMVEKQKKLTFCESQHHRAHKFEE
jgi:hypothetical protein